MLICPVGSIGVPSFLVSSVLLQVMIFLGWDRLNSLTIIVVGCSGTAFVRECRGMMESVGTVTGTKEQKHSCHLVLCARYWYPG